MNVKIRLLAHGYKLTESFRKCSILLVAATFILSAALHFQPVNCAAGNVGNYIVTEASKLSMITPGGVRTVIYDYPSGRPLGVAVDSAGNYIVVDTFVGVEWEYSWLFEVTPEGAKTMLYDGGEYTYYDRVAIDSAGNYIVTESGKLSMITPSGVRTVIYDYAGSGTSPSGVAVDGAGNYIVTETSDNKLCMITPGGVRTVIHSFAPNTFPSGVAVDNVGNYIVTECLAQKLSMITPSGARTVIYSFGPDTGPNDVAVESAGNYIIVERDANKLSMITPGGVRTVIHSFAPDTMPWDVAIVPGAIDPSTFDEYFDGIWYTPFDSDGDGYNDAIDVEMEVDTTYSGTLGVEAGAYLKKASGTAVDTDFPSWSITDGATEYGYADVFVPAGSPEGWYIVSLGLWDEWGNYEDYRIDGFQTYLYPPSTGPIYVRADGSIDPATAPITTTDKITYVLTDNIEGSIVVERSDIVFDGAGYTMLGKGEDVGIMLKGTIMVTVRNITIKGCSVGIFLESSSVNSVLSDNNVKNNTCGIWVGPSSFGNALSGNNVNNNTGGIWLDSSSFNNVLSNNNVTTNDVCGIFLNDSSHNTLSGNIVTPTPMGGIVLNYSSNNALSGNKVEGNGNGAGIWLSYSFSNVVSGNNLTGNDDGIVLDHSSLNTLSGNNVTAGIETGICLRGSSNNNLLSGNNVSANSGYGIYLRDSSSNNLLSGNNVTGNDDGIVLLSSSINSLSGNKIANNDEMGIHLMTSSSGNFLSGNDVAGNWVGIRLDSSSYNFLFDNNLANNKCGIYLEGSSLDNTFYHNNFMANKEQVNSTYTDSLNVWDDGYPSGGNYWSDHNPPDADKDKIGDSPYVLDENNGDRYPLIYPFECYMLGYVCSPDLNKDGAVNIVDIAIVATAFNRSPGDSKWNAIADLDLDETINIVDITIVAKQFGKK